MGWVGGRVDMMCLVREYCRVDASDAKTNLRALHSLQLDSGHPMRVCTIEAQVHEKKKKKNEEEEEEDYNEDIERLKKTKKEGRNEKRFLPNPNQNNPNLTLI